MEVKIAGGGGGRGGGQCHTMMKLATVISYLKKIHKLYESHNPPLEFAGCSGMHL